MNTLGCLKVKINILKSEQIHWYSKGYTVYCNTSDWFGFEFQVNFAADKVFARHDNRLLKTYAAMVLLNST